MQDQPFRNDLRDAYDKYAQERDAYELEEWKSKEREHFLALLQQNGGKKLLEVGAGPGRDSKYFQDQGLDVICIDLSPAMVELCRQKGLTAYVMDMTNIDFPDNSFDAVYAMNSLLHLTKSEFPEVLHRMDALLRTDGLAYIGVYGGILHDGIWENDRYTPKRFFSFFSDEALEQEVSKVFEIVYFTQVFFEPDDPLHFQSLILKKTFAR